jgi:hypothetical protein
MTTLHTPRINPLTGEFITSKPSCDFCGRELVDTWARFGCGDFVRHVPGPVPIGIHLVGFWAACDSCAPLVRTRRWRKLVDHVIAVRGAAGIPDANHPEARRELAALYLQLERHLTGVETRGGAA